MRLFKSRRGLVALVVLAAAAATLFAVTALASNPGDYVSGPSGQGVLPIDVAIGGTGDCANLFTNLPAGSYSEYDNVNPKTGTFASGHGDGASFQLTTSGSNKFQMLAVTATGARIVGIGIKGGTQSTAYDYQAAPVTSDTALHAPAQAWSSTTQLNGRTEELNVTQYYSLSQLTVCYTQGSVGGNVYQDNNLSGAYDGTPTDANLAGWTIHLYKNGGLVGTGTSNASGVYKIGAIFDPAATYTLCEAPPSGTWAQTEPDSGSAITCSGTGELKRGWSLTPGSALDNIVKNFGNVAAITCSSGPFGITGYQVGTCKPTQTYVFSSGVVNGKPYVSYWVGDPTQQGVPTVERVSFDDPWSGGGPTLTKILFEDANGFQAPTDNAPAMSYCNVDPRDTTPATGYPESYALKAPYDTDPTGVLPAGATSCLISLKITAPAGTNPNGTLVAYIYSTTDSFRVGA